MSRLLFFTTLFAAAAVLTPTTVFVDGFTTNYGDHRHDGKGRDDGGGVTVVGFRQIVCRAACPSDPKGVNCTTTSFAIGECMATPEPDVFALLLNCVPPPPGPHPPPIMKGSKGWEGEEEKKKGDGAASDHNNRIQRIGKARAVVRVAEEANGGGGQHDHRHSDQNDQSSSSSSSPSFSSSSSPSSSSRQAPLPPHIALRYIINNSTMPFNKSTTCYYGVNASGVVKQAVGQCFAIAPAPSSALTTTTGGGAEKSESQLPSSNDGLVFYPSFAVAEGNGRRTRDESSRADEGKQRQQDEEAAAAEAFVRSDLMMRRRRRRALKRLKKEEDNKGDDDSTYLYAINFCDLN